MDKDLWVVENIFPKNTELNEPRKPRRNLTQIDISKATRKTKITFCILGSWAIYMPPYGMARLSALTREAGYLTRVHDFNVESWWDLKAANPALEPAWGPGNFWWWRDPEYFEKIHPTYEPILETYLETILENDIDILGFSLYYTNILPTQWMIKRVRERRPDITIVVGGPECYNPGYQPSAGIDYYFVGESEQHILDFLNNWENGIKPLDKKIGSLYSDTRIDIDSLPYPDYSDYDLTKYWGKNSVCAEISRGCVAKCTYCTEVHFWKFRDRGASNVLDELEYQIKHYGVRHVSFVDSLLNGNLKEFKKLCEGMIERKLGITWWGYARCDGRMDLEFYKVIAASGGQGMNYGIESGSDKVLKVVNKKNTVAEINQNLIDSEKVGMKVSACLVIGAPGEDIEALTHTFNMLWNHRRRIAATSPGTGLGDTQGSDYDNREKHGISSRDKTWMGGWHTLDLLNTRLHRYKRLKLLHIWLFLCKEYGGTLVNIHKTGDITQSFEVKFDNEYINDHVEYENFDYNIIKTDNGDFADSVMNEMFGFLRMLWRVRGGYEIEINFSPELDNIDWAFTLEPSLFSYTASIWFKITEDGDYQINASFDFVNNDRMHIKSEGFKYVYASSGKWSESKKTFINKIFHIKQAKEDRVSLPFESAFGGVDLLVRKLLLKLAKELPANSVVVDIQSEMGGRAAIMAHANKNISINCFENFQGNLVSEQFGYMIPFIPEDLKAIALEADLDVPYAEQIENYIREDMLQDPSGKLAFQRNTKKYTNIKLHESLPNNEFYNQWDHQVDLCVITAYDSNNLTNYLQFWLKHLKPTGQLAIRPYNTVHHPDIVESVNEMISSKEWNIVDQAESMIVLQRAIG